MSEFNQTSAGLWPGSVVRRFPELDSSNTWAVAHAPDLTDGDVVWVECQTAGRGRHDRTWLAMPGKSLTISLLLRHDCWAAIGANLGQAAALCLVAMLERYGLCAQVKWPNDVMVEDRKIAGILVERAGDDAFVVGIGLNVNLDASDFRQAGLDRPVTSMSQALGRPLEVASVLEDLLTELRSVFTAVRDHGVAPLWRQWARYDWLLTRTVKILDVNGEVQVGDYLGVAPNGALRLRTLEGYEKLFWSGDVERVSVS